MPIEGNTILRVGLLTKTSVTLWGIYSPAILFLLIIVPFHWRISHYSATYGPNISSVIMSEQSNHSLINQLFLRIK